MGREDVTGANVLIALFAERDSRAAELLQEQDITRFDVVKYVSHGISKVDQEKEARAKLPVAIARSIARSAESAPEFRAYRGRIRYRQSRASTRIAERKAAVVERCTELQRRCIPRENEQPELKNLVDRYASALRSLRKDRGAYKLFLLGLEIETLLRTRTETRDDPERNPQLDADLLFAARALIIAHAGLIMLFPDVKRITGAAYATATPRRSVEGLLGITCSAAGT
jgi:hypothetical protein